jgi:hypothetical protein
MENIPNQEQMPNPVSKKFPWGRVAIFVVILILLAAGAFWLQSRTHKPMDNNQTTENGQNNNQQVNSQEPLVSDLIDWHYPTKTGLDIFTDTEYGRTIASQSEFYSVGTFKSGQYQGKNLVYAEVSMDCPCSPVVLRLVVDPAATSNSFKLLKNYSDPLDNLSEEAIDMGSLKVDATTKISDLEAPATLRGPQPNQDLILAKAGPFQSAYNIFNATNLKPVYFDAKVGQVYTTPDNPQQVDQFFRNYGFYVKMPDWNVAIYKIVPNFVGNDNIPKVTWDGGGVNKDEFQFVRVNGCGSTDFAAVMDVGTVKMSDLKEVGKTSQGDLVYEFKDSNVQMLKDMYNNDYHPFNPSTGQETDKLTYEQVVASHPMFFWVDPFDRLIQFKNKSFVVSQAECGKPAIYLYPTKTQSVSVKVDPQGGFSKTDPEYGNGWNVVADPSGKIMVNGKEYPYLFWEGRGGLYQMPDKGFVVESKNIHPFLTDKLSKLGLNQKESAEFIEYWEPQMHAAPYYFVSFMGNDVMDQLAPLMVSPAPDTVIRVLMDFKPLQSPVSVQGYDIKTPIRRGFTVVEWGGVKR